MDTRSFVVGAAVGAIITAIAFVAFRSDSTSTVAAKSDTAMNREAPTSPADDSPPREPAKAAHPAAADSGIPPAPQPAGSLSQTDAKEPARDKSAEELGKRIQAEARDESWAPAAENALGDYLARQPYPDALGSPSIECRATLCAVWTLVDAAVLQAAPSADLQAAMANIQYDSLGRELVPLTNAMTTIPEVPGQVFMLAYLQRADRTSNLKP
jgi:hypothetical protein